MENPVINHEQLEARYAGGKLSFDTAAHAMVLKAIATLAAALAPLRLAQFYVTFCGLVNAVVGDWTDDDNLRAACKTANLKADSARKGLQRLRALRNLNDNDKAAVFELDKGKVPSRRTVDARLGIAGDGLLTALLAAYRACAVNNGDKPDKTIESAITADPCSFADPILAAILTVADINAEPAVKGNNKSKGNNKPADAPTANPAP